MAGFLSTVIKVSIFGDSRCSVGKDAHPLKIQGHGPEPSDNINKTVSVQKWMKG
jgi:hypothetical protein